jgi:hypothetical protein
MAAAILRDLWTWDAYGAASALPAWAPHNVLYPGAWSTVAVSNPPWMPSAGTGYALKFTGASAPSTGTNPGSGVYSIPRWAGTQGAILGFWYKVTAFPSSSIAFLRLNNSRTTSSAQVPPQGVDQSYLNLSSSGVIGAQNAGNTSAGTYSSLSLNTWYWMEYFVFVGDTSGGSNKQGSTQLSINGTAQITNTNIVTRFSSNSYDIDNYTFDGEFDQTCVQYFGPGYWMDPNGNAAAAMLGSQYFQTLTPSALSGSSTFTPVGSTRIANITTLPPAGGDYNECATQSDIEIYTTGACQVSGINAVGVQIAVAQSARGGRMAGLVLKSGATQIVMQGMGTLGGPNTAGGSYADGTTFFVKRALALTDPNTSIAWTTGGAGSALIGQEVLQ